MMLKMLVYLSISLMYTLQGAAESVFAKQDDAERLAASYRVLFNNCFTIMPTRVPGTYYSMPVMLDAGTHDDPCFIVGFVESPIHEGNVLQNLEETLKEQALHLCSQGASKHLFSRYNNILINIYVCRQKRYMDVIPPLIIPAYLATLLANIPQDEVNQRRQSFQNRAHDDVNVRIELLQEQADEVHTRHEASILMVDIPRLKEYVHTRYGEDMCKSMCILH